MVTKKPKYWSSAIDGKYPLSRKFPCYGVIEQIYDCVSFVTMNDTNGYGWSLDSLIEDNIIKDIKLIRKKKLQKLQVINEI